MVCSVNTVRPMWVGCFKSGLARWKMRNWHCTVQIIPGPSWCPHNSIFSFWPFWDVWVCSRSTIGVMGSKMWNLNSSGQITFKTQVQVAAPIIWFFCHFAWSWRSRSTDDGVEDTNVKLPLVPSWCPYNSILSFLLLCVVGLVLSQQLVWLSRGWEIKIPRVR